MTPGALLWGCPRRRAHGCHAKKGIPYSRRENSLTVPASGSSVRLAQGSILADWLTRAALRGSFSRESQSSLQSDSQRVKP